MKETKPSDAQNPSQSAVARLVEAIENQILAGEFRDGDSLPPERQFVAEFGVSRPVAREAIKTLTGKGLVEVRPRHRPTVKSPTPTSVIDALGGMVHHFTEGRGGTRQIFELRIFVEAGLAREAAKAAKKDDIARLRTALDKNEQAIQDSIRFYETDTAFHGVLYTILTNPILPAIHQAFSEWLDPRWRQMPRLPERNRENFEAHRAILDAIRDRDPDAAEATIRAHLDDAWSQVERSFEGD